MFGKFKEKLKSWTKNLSKEAEETEEVEETKEEVQEIKKTEEKKEEKKKVEEPSVEKVKKEVEEIEEGIDKLLEKEEKIEEEKEEPGSKGFFKKITSKISKVKITEKEFEIYKEELEMILLENNVAFEVTEKIVEELEEKIVGKEFLKKEIEEEIKEALKEILRNILVEGFDVYKAVKDKKEKSGEPYIIMFCGVNGTGKTTTIAKVASNLKKKGLSCVLAAADTFRAASIEQIKEHANKIGVKVIAHEYGHDPASVGFDAIKYAKKNAIDCVLIDTAGRMHTSKNLLQEIEKIAKVNNPDLKVFVGESTTGNDAIEQVKSFDWHVGIDGIILTKADIDEKGGTALSVGYITKKPILYLGTGQTYDEIEPFDKEDFIKKLGLDEDLEE